MTDDAGLAGLHQTVRSPYVLEHAAPFKAIAATHRMLVGVLIIEVNVFFYFFFRVRYASIFYFPFTSPTAFVITKYSASYIVRSILIYLRYVIFLTGILPIPIPTGPPLNVKVQYLPASNLLLLTWDQPAINERNGIINDYRINHYIHDDEENFVTTETRLNYITIKNPSASTRYRYRVNAGNTAGVGPYSDFVEVVTPDVIFTGKLLLTLILQSHFL